MAEEPLVIVREWIRSILDEKGWSGGKLAKVARVAPSTITRALDPNYPHIPTTRTIAKIAEAVGRTPPDLGSIGVANQRVIRKQIPVMGEVRAGVWHDLREELVPEEYLYFDDPEFARANVWALRVVGRSMDLKYPDGSTVIVADAADTGVQEGDDVIVRQREGNRYETTIKEVVVEDGGIVALYPRSSDPSFQPLRLKKRDQAAQEGAEIIAVVIATYSKRSRRPGRFVNF